MNIKDIKADAELEAAAIEINWESLENPTYRKEFEEVLQKASAFLPELESLYTKLTSGKSVLTPDEDTPLGYADVEKYSGLVGEELYSTYVLNAVYEKYTLINSIVGTDKKSPLDNQPPIDYI
jgi:hypothetical protein